MTRKLQKSKVKRLTSLVINPLINAIESGKIPESWGEPEIKEFLKDSFASLRGPGMKIARYRNYLKDILSF